MPDRNGGGTQTPIAQWGFGDSGSTYADAVGGKALATGTTAPTKVAGGIWGQFLRFNGTTDYLKMAGANIGNLNIGAGSGKITVVAWLKRNVAKTAMIAGILEPIPLCFGRERYAGRLHRWRL